MTFDQFISKHLGKAMDYDGVSGVQCVDLIKYYLDEVFGIKQRIYKKSPVKYEDLGLNIKEKGKRKILNKNFRSTAEIVKLANSLKFYDTDDKLSEKHFVRSGDRPIIHKSDDDRKAIRYIIDEIRK